MSCINGNEEANIRNTCTCLSCVIWREQQRNASGMAQVVNEEDLPIDLKLELDRFCSSLKRSPYAEAGLKRNFAKKIKRFIKQELNK